MNIYARGRTDRKPRLVLRSEENAIPLLQNMARTAEFYRHKIYWRRDGKGFDAFKNGQHVYAAWIA